MQGKLQLESSPIIILTEHVSNSGTPKGLVKAMDKVRS
jgi:hypothetical protein